MNLIDSVQGATIAFYTKWKIKKNGFWFIDIPKTSSTSIRAELGGKHGLVYLKSESKFSFQAHKSGSYMIEYLGRRSWDKLFTFSFVRNPWDKTLSFYLYGRSIGYFQQFDFKNFVFEIKKEFDSGNSIFHWPGPYQSCSYYLFSKKGELLVDFVGKIENREEDIKVVREKINKITKTDSLKFSKNAIGSLHLNSVTQIEKDRLQYYTPELIDIVKSLYQIDIKNFDYRESDFF